MIENKAKRKRSDRTKSTDVKRAQGRPLQRSSGSNAVNRSLILRKLQHYHSKQQHILQESIGRLSQLERLPVELIQQIFFHALEVNLPRASAHLQRALSNPAIYDALILFAFFDDDGHSPVETKHFLPSEYRELMVLEKVCLQESIFACKWCTYDRVISCLPALSRLAMVQAWYRENFQGESHDQDQRDREADAVVADEAIRVLAILPRLEDEAKLEEHFLARASIENPGSSDFFTRRATSTTFLPRIITWESSLDVDGRIHKHTDKSMSILAVRHIPDRLLSEGSLEGDKLALLQLLRQGYTFLQWDHVLSISASAVFNGMRTAVDEGNVVGLKTLLELHNVFFRSSVQPPRGTTTSGLTAATHHSLPLDLFHRATKQRTDSSELMSLLLRAGIDALPLDDETMTAWAVYRSQENDPLATWLLQYMDGSANLFLREAGHLFEAGRLSQDVGGSNNSLFPTTTFATELGYLEGTPITPTAPDGGVCGTRPVNTQQPTGRSW